MKRFALLVLSLSFLVVCVSEYSAAQATDSSAILHPCGFNVIQVPGAQPESSLPTSINDEGIIVGSFQDANNGVHGFIFKNGKFTTADFPNGRNTHLTQINNRGQILGSVDSTDTSQTPVSFVLDDGKFTVLDFPNVPSNGITGFNDFDEFIGIDQRTGLQGFVVVKGTRIDTPNFNGSTFFINGINDRGVLVGAAPSSDSPLILRYGQFSPLPPSPPGTGQVGVNAINNRNQIVGGLVETTSNISQAYFLSEDGVYTIFGFPGDIQNTAIAVNDRLQIVGASADTSFKTKRWVTQLCTSPGK